MDILVMLAIEVSAWMCEVNIKSVRYGCSCEVKYKECPHGCSCEVKYKEVSAIERCPL